LLSFHDQLQPPAQASRADLPSAVDEQGGVHVRASFVPMMANAKAKTDPEARIVGMGPVVGGFVNSSERLRDRILAKAGGRYQIEDVPLLVAAGIHDFVCSDDQVLEALYGAPSR
jgi:hypothetical protein